VASLDVVGFIVASPVPETFIYMIGISRSSLKRASGCQSAFISPKAGVTKPRFETHQTLRCVDASKAPHVFASTSNFRVL